MNLSDIQTNITAYDDGVLVNLSFLYLMKFRVEIIMLRYKILIQPFLHFVMITSADFHLILN